MEMLLYKCEICGFVYQVPAYWSDFSSETHLEMTHVNLQTQEMCSCNQLTLIE